MEEAINDQNRQAFTLFELNSMIRAALDLTFPEACWVIAEIAESKCNQRGHCYLELVEKDDDKTIAQIKATIWAYDFRRIGQKFQNATKETLKPGMKVMLLAAVTFHEVYGLSLNIKDIDPTYTMGEMARRKKEIIERLRKEDLLDLNKKLSLPLVPQRIAVISSPTAAGYEDFFKQLDNNPYGYKFIHILFPALMQGQEAEASISSALDRIKRHSDQFDIVVIIRGGGSATDLSCFDSYALVACIAQFPLPVITGIGHEKDDTVADIVAHTKMKTPTAVAEFLISGVNSFEQSVLDLQDRLISHIGRFIKDERYKIDIVAQKMALLPSRIVAAEQNRLALFKRELDLYVRQFIHRAENSLGRYEQAARLLDPANVLKRGYSITRHKGKVIKDADTLRKGQRIETKFHNGTITSIVEKKPEAKQHEQEQTDYLFPGFERA